MVSGASWGHDIENTGPRLISRRSLGIHTSCMGGTTPFLHNSSSFFLLYQTRLFMGHGTGIDVFLHSHIANLQKHSYFSLQPNTHPTFTFPSVGIQTSHALRSLRSSYIQPEYCFQSSLSASQRISHLFKFHSNKNAFRLHAQSSDNTHTHSERFLLRKGIPFTKPYVFDVLVCHSSMDTFIPSGPPSGIRASIIHQIHSFFQTSPKSSLVTNSFSQIHTLPILNHSYQTIPHTFNVRR